jgi:metal-responsive CopG/Arc/MetJ family transcriptional regulator
MSLQDESEVIEVRLSQDQLRALDAWRVQHRGAATRADAIRQLVHSALSRDLQQTIARGDEPADEGLRPEQLNSENDA